MGLRAVPSPPDNPHDQPRHRSDPDLRLPRSAVVIVVVVGVLQAAGLVALVLLARDVIEALIPHDVGAARAAVFDSALRKAGIIALLGLALGVLRTIEFAVSERAGYEVVRRLRMDMYRHLTRMMPHQLRHRARGGLLLRLTGDLSMLRMWLSRGLLQGSVALLMLLAGVGTTLALNVWIGVAVLTILGLTTALSVASGKAMRDATRTMRRRRSLVIGNIDEQINSMAVVQTAGRVNGETTRLSRQNDSLTRALCRVADLRGRLRGLATAGAYLSVAAVLAIGLVEVRRGAVTPATVLICVLITRLLARPVRTLGLAHDYWHRGQVSRQKVGDFLRSSARIPDVTAEPLRVRRGDIELRDVTVAGQLQRFSAVIRRREIVAITGPAGSGASAVLHVLARLVEPTDGSVVIDGQELADTTWQSGARRIGIVSPDLPLLRGTVRRNLGYSSRDAGAEEIQRVSLALGLDETLARHGSAGVGTWLTEGGNNLEPGDRQLVKLGRAMIGNPPLLLLEDPVTGLDPEARTRVRELLSRYQGTVVMVTNDAEDIAIADVVWRMNAGQLVESTTAAEYREDLRRHETGRLPWLAPVGR